MVVRYSTLHGAPPFLPNGGTYSCTKSCFLWLRQDIINPVPSSSENWYFPAGFQKYQYPIHPREALGSTQGTQISSCQCQGSMGCILEEKIALYNNLQQMGKKKAVQCPKSAEETSQVFCKLQYVWHPESSGLLVLQKSHMIPTWIPEIAPQVHGILFASLTRFRGSWFSITKSILAKLPPHHLLLHILKNCLALMAQDMLQIWFFKGNSIFPLWTVLPSYSHGIFANYRHVQPCSCTNWPRRRNCQNWKHGLRRHISISISIGCPSWALPCPLAQPW